MIAVGQKFDNLMISLDGSSYRDCEFSQCVFFFSGLLPVDLRGSSFTECRWEFVGPAANTMGFLKALYQRGETQLVEAVFADVRGESAHHHHHGDDPNHAH